MEIRKKLQLKKAAILSAGLAAVLTIATLTAPETILAKDSSVSAGRVAQRYEMKDGTWDATTGKLTLPNGETAKDCFFCDGTYTYYLQHNGTPMKDRLTYHPDGEHVIYFDENGHEVFSNFKNVKRSISGDPVDDLCFFDVFGHMYVDVVTYDQSGKHLYYANPYGVMERKGWFTFSEKQGGGIGYANADGTLAVNCEMVDPSGRTVHLQGNGVAQESVSLISSVNCKSAIETDVTLDGNGTGCHAKLVICTGSAAISYGLQYDACAVAPYTGKTMVMTENVFSNATGGQVYDRPGNIEVAKCQTHHLMLTVNGDGSGAVYFNNQLIGTYSNPGLAGQHVYLRVEASGRVNGDTVTARFSNIKCKVDGTVYNGPIAQNDFSTNRTITHSCSGSDIIFSGYVSDLGPGEDWDNRYQSVSGIIQMNW